VSKIKALYTRLIKRVYTTSIESQKHKNLFLYDKKNKVILDWSHKCGCTVTTRMFFDAMGLLGDVKKFRSGGIHTYRTKKFRYDHPVTTRDILSSENFLFKVVRNPYTRVVSSYIDACAKHNENKKNDYLAVTGVKDYQKLTFKQFINALAKIDLTRQANPHQLAQVKNYERKGLRQPFICKLETLSEDIKIVNKHCNSCFSIDGLSSAHHAKKSAALTNFCANKPFDEFQGIFPEYKYFYDRETFDKGSSPKVAVNFHSSP
jgi:hypothetical protein